MIRILKASLIGLLLCGASAVLSYAEVTSPSPEAQVPEASPRNLDIDSLYVRNSSPYLLAMESAALAEYDKRNPKTALWYENGRKAVRLFVLQQIAEDFHGEGLLMEADTYSALAYQAGCHDPLISAVCDILVYRKRHSLKRDNLEGHLSRVDALAQSNYPAVLKAPALVIAAVNLASVYRNRAKWKDDLSEFLSHRAQYLNGALDQLESAVTAGMPENIAVEQIAQIVEIIDQDSSNMNSLGEGIEPLITRIKFSPNARAAAMGNFLVSWAWTARGSGWAKDVTPEGWRLMNERLTLAAKILEEARSNSPEDIRLPLILMTVELGQGGGKYRMNQLFDDALRIEPSNYQAHSKKIYYLQPRWYGTLDDVIAFGLTCAKTKDYANKLPLVLQEGIWLLADQQESLFKSEKVWVLIQPIFEEYLKQFPNSVRIRTRYLQWAIHGEYWDIARAQRDILAGNWDRNNLSKVKYTELVSKIPLKNS